MLRRARMNRTESVLNDVMKREREWRKKYENLHMRYQNMKANCERLQAILKKHGIKES